MLPPTVLGYYLLLGFGRQTWLGQVFESLTGTTLAFSFSGLLLASVVYSLPFAVQPMLRAFEGIPCILREAAWCSGLSRWQTFRRVEFPLAWPGDTHRPGIDLCAYPGRVRGGADGGR